VAGAHPSCYTADSSFPEGMAMAEGERRTRTQVLDVGKADEKKRHAGVETEYANEMAGESAILEGLLQDPAMELPVERHAAILGDARFSHPANGSRKALSMIQMQRDYGNAYVQRMLQRTEAGAQDSPNGRQTDTSPPSQAVTSRQPTSATIIARSADVATDEELEELMEEAAPGEVNFEEIIEAAGETTVVEEAEFGAGTPSEEWPELQPVQRTQIRDLIRAGQRQEATDRMWGWLTLPEKARVVPPPQVTNQLGVVDGDPVATSGALESGVCIPYVLATSACAGCSESEHWQRHNRGELRAVIQVHHRVFARDAEEAVGQLLSTLMHEYTHVEQMVDEGLHEGVALSAYPQGSRAAVGEKEYLTFAAEVVPPAERRVLEGLQEIDTTCSEIENAERTGLTGLGLQGVVNYLWTNYRRYCSNVEGGTPDVDVEDRAYRNLVRGRQLFTAYLDQSSDYSTHRQFLLDRCPEDYDASLMSGRSLTETAEGETPETEPE
jgi:hypothetical protein